MHARTRAGKIAAAMPVHQFVPVVVGFTLVELLVVIGIIADADQRAASGLNAPGTSPADQVRVEYAEHGAALQMYLNQFKCYLPRGEDPGGRADVRGLASAAQPVPERQGPVPLPLAGRGPRAPARSTAPGGHYADASASRWGYNPGDRLLRTDSNSMPFVRLQRLGANGEPGFNHNRESLGLGGDLNCCRRRLSGRRKSKVARSNCRRK